MCHVVAAAICGLVQAAQLTLCYAVAAASMALHMTLQAMTLQALRHIGQYNAKLGIAAMRAHMCHFFDMRLQASHHKDCRHADVMPNAQPDSCRIT